MKLFKIGYVMMGVGEILIGTVVIIAAITHRFLNILLFVPACVIIPAWIVLLQRRKRKQLKGK